MEDTCLNIEAGYMMHAHSICYSFGLSLPVRCNAGIQEKSILAPRAPKLAPKAPKLAPREPKLAQRAIKIGSKSAQVASELAPGAPKLSPRGTPEAPS